jgi:hypothetical protein
VSDETPPRRSSFEDLSDLDIEHASRTAAGGRTPILITAAVVLFAGAVFALLSVALVAEFSSTASMSGTAVAFLLAYAIVQAVTGALVLLLVPAGRWLGIFVGIAGIALGVFLASSAPASGLVSILLSAFVIYALASSGPSFRRG